MGELLYQQVAGRVAEEIRDGVYLAGQKVPSVRKLSKQFNVSLATVVQAYGSLEDQGLIRAKPQSGYFVRSNVVMPVEPPPISRNNRPKRVTKSQLISDILALGRQKGLVQLGAAVPDRDCLPWRAMQQHINKVCRYESEELTSYSFSPGNEQLRRLIAIRMRDAGVRVSHDQIVITNGCMEALSLSVRCLTKANDIIAVESPCYYGHLNLAESLGLKLVEIPTDPVTGVSLEALKLAVDKWPIKACIFSARNSNPTGATLARDKQNALVEFLRKKKIPLIEDDVYGELTFNEDIGATFKSFDQSDDVIYCSSFSKTIGPGFRIGWCIPGKIQPKFQEMQLYSTMSASSFCQSALASYLGQGGYDKHLRMVRNRYRQTAAAYQLAVSRHFPEGTKISRPEGGVVLWISLPPSIDAFELHRQAQEEGINIMPGGIFSSTKNFDHFLRITCTRPMDREVDEAIVKIGMLAKALDRG